MFFIAVLVVWDSPYLVVYSFFTGWKENSPCGSTRRSIPSLVYRLRSFTNCFSALVRFVLKKTVLMRSATPFSLKYLSICCTYWRRPPKICFFSMYAPSTVCMSVIYTMLSLNDAERAYRYTVCADSECSAFAFFFADSVSVAARRSIPRNLQTSSECH